MRGGGSRVHELIDGPDQYWSEHLPPSRGQYRDLALLGLRLLGIEEPIRLLIRRSLEANDGGEA
jgi:hypothetical protein